MYYTMYYTEEVFEMLEKHKFLWKTSLLKYFACTNKKLIAETITLSWSTGMYWIHNTIVYFTDPIHCKFVYTLSQLRDLE